jgi:protoheme IX farnesyltransferase
MDRASLRDPRHSALVRLRRIYLICTLALDAMFVSYALRLNLRNGEALAMPTFRFSVKYLMWLFAALLTDHYLMLPK